MRVHDATAGEAREPDVRERGEREPGVAHPAERAERDGRAGPVVRPDRRDAERRKPSGGGRGVDAAGDLSLVVEGEEGDDRQRRDGAHGLHGDDELVQVEEGLDHEKVDPASLEHARLRGVQRAVLGEVEHLELAERADRARDEDVAAGDLSRVAS